MLKTSVTTLEVVAFLNDLVKLDRKAMHDLIETRVGCIRALAEHPTAQVVSLGEDNTNFEIGVLGLLNGIFGVDAEGCGPISAVFEEVEDSWYLDRFIARDPDFSD